MLRPLQEAVELASLEAGEEKGLKRWGLRRKRFRWASICKVGRYSHFYKIAKQFIAKGI